MATEQYTEQQLSFLTPDERSALEAESATDEDAAVLEALAAEAEAEETETKPEGEAETKPAAATSTEAEKPVDGEKAAEAAPVEPVATLPGDKTFHAEAPKDAAEQRKTLRAEEAKALKQMMDGEIEPEAYIEIKSRVSDELEALVRAETTADVSARMAVQAKANDWTRALNEAVIEAKKDGLDYLGNKDMGAEFDSLLKVYADRAAAQGMTDDDLAASRWALTEAGKMMRKMHGTPAKPATDAAAVAAAAAKKAEEPAAARHNLTTLGKLPAADRAPIADDVMAKIASLEGENLEKYLATLSSKEIDRIMAGS